MSNSNRASAGSTLDSWLTQEGLLEEATSDAIKSVLSFQLKAAMQEKGLTKQAMANAMDTSRAQLNRLLDPNNKGVTLETLQRAAKVVGREIRLELV